MNTIETPEILLENGYRYLKLVGEGANAKTYQARSLKTGEIVAIKAIKFSENLKNYELFKREAETLKTIHLPGVPQFYDYIVGNSEFTECWLVQEYIVGNSILDKLEQGTHYNETEVLLVMYEIAKIIDKLQTVYSPPIIHRDIKPSNILVRENQEREDRLCLIDFGAVANPQKRSENSTVAGTVGYMAPEQLIGDCTVQSDYYALGATALHMLTGIAPSEFPSDGFTLKFEDKLRERLPKIHNQTVELLRQLLAANANERPADSAALVHVIGSTYDSVIGENYLEKIGNTKLFAFLKRWEGALDIFAIFSILIVLIFFLLSIGTESSFGLMFMGATIFIVIVAIIIYCKYFLMSFESKRRHGLKDANLPVLLAEQTNDQNASQNTSQYKTVEATVWRSVAAQIVDANVMYDVTYTVDHVTYGKRMMFEEAHQVGDKVKIQVQV